MQWYTPHSLPSVSLMSAEKCSPKGMGGRASKRKRNNMVKERERRGKRKEKKKIPLHAFTTLPPFAFTFSVVASMSCTMRYNIPPCNLICISFCLSTSLFYLSRVYLPVRTLSELSTQIELVICFEK
jgi:hypothetical protein